MENATESAKRPRTRRCRSALSVCQDCENRLTDENWTPSMQKYKRYVCGPCWTIRQRKYAAADPLRNEKQRMQRKNRMANWTEAQHLEHSRKRYNNWLIRKYGIGLKEYEQLLESQLMGCAVCATKEPGGRGGFHLDHCHGTKKIRGLLCSNCNLMIGLAKDRPEILKAAADYLERAY